MQPGTPDAVNMKVVHDPEEPSPHIAHTVPRIGFSPSALKRVVHQIVSIVAATGQRPRITAQAEHPGQQLVVAVLATEIISNGRVSRILHPVVGCLKSRWSGAPCHFFIMPSIIIGISFMLTMPLLSFFILSNIAS